jgi:uncharacterized membrane protein
MKRIRGWARRVSDSLFLLPVLIIGGLAALALVALFLDTRWAADLGETPFLLASTVAGGRSIATTVAGATITVAAVVFSITALSSQIAANQYSPRAVRGFFEDRVQQVVIGIIVGTFTYCLLILGRLSLAVVGASDPTPSIAITLAVLLGVASAIGIVAYIDHSLRRFQVDSVVRRIAEGTVRSINNSHRQAITEPVKTETALPSGESAIVRSNETGWIQSITPNQLAESLPAQATVRVAVALGETVSAGDHLATVWPGNVVTEELEETIRGAIVAERDRSLDNDPAFGIRQLVDIALKALSPGINDPTTAVDVVHHLKVPIRVVLQSAPPERVFYGPDGQRVYLAETPSRSDYVHLAFSEIRLAGGSQPGVLRALLDVLDSLRNELTGAHLEGRVGALDEEIELTIAATRASGLPAEDIKRVLSIIDVEPMNESGGDE